MRRDGQLDVRKTHKDQRHGEAYVRATMSGVGSALKRHVAELLEMINQACILGQGLRSATM